MRDSNQFADSPQHNRWRMHAGENFMMANHANKLVAYVVLGGGAQRLGALRMTSLRVAAIGMITCWMLTLWMATGAGRLAAETIADSPAPLTVAVSVHPLARVVNSLARSPAIKV